MKHILIATALVFSTTSTVIFAQDVIAPKQDPKPEGLEDLYISDRELPLDSKELAALALARKWRENPEQPRMSQDGKITFLYGTTMPPILCAPLRESDIELEAGEVVRDIHLGDTVRWSVQPAVSGPEDNKTTHIILKANDAGLFTSLIVTTDRRTYHFSLKSTREDWTPRVGFDYPDGFQRTWASYRAAVKTVRDERTMPETRQDVTKLDFEYKITGKAKWAPMRVYNDGVKTYIQMPGTMAQTEAPVVLVIGPDKKEQLVNYRLVGDRYVVDQIFDRAVLMAGVGRKQTRVEIERK
jgi:type IV secretion system protein VirB9